MGIEEAPIALNIKGSFLKLLLRGDTLRDVASNWALSARWLYVHTMSASSDTVAARRWQYMYWLMWLFLCII